MGIRRAVAFGRRHPWPVTVIATVAAVLAVWGEFSAVSLMMNGPFVAGYLLAAVCGDVLIYAIGVPLLLWVPLIRARRIA